MQYLHAFIGCTFIVIALIHAPHPNPWSWAPYSAAAILAFITLKPEITEFSSRLLALVTTALMFYFFASFFLMVPKLEAADWYLRLAGWSAVCKILAAFVMIPLLSDFSCRLKKECREARLSERRGFFSVPDHLPPDHLPPHT